jgi:hypothetical protein
MAGIRYLTNEDIDPDASTNNYLPSFNCSAGNISSIDLVLRADFPAPPLFSADYGLVNAFSRIKVSFDGVIGFDAYQTSNNLDAYMFDEVDFIRTALNGATEGQTVMSSVLTDTHYEAILRIPIMQSQKGSRVQIQYDTLDFSDSTGGLNPTSFTADIVVNYVDSLQGKFEVRKLAREANVPTTGNTLLQIPEVSGYAIESILLKSTSAGNLKTEQFGVGSRISLGDIQGNILIDEMSGVESTIHWQSNYGSAVLGGLQLAAITNYQPAVPMTALTGMILIEAGQVVGSAVLRLTPSAAVANLDVMVVYVARNTNNASLPAAKSLTKTVDAIGENTQSVGQI